MNPTKRKIRVAVIMGGQSSEHEVSLKSGQGILHHLPQTKYQPTAVVIDKNGNWHFHYETGEQVVELPSALVELKAKFDLAFLALHGPNGEDGTMQAVLELMKIPYTFSDHYASSLAMNKPRAKDVYRSAGLKTPDWVEVSLRELKTRPFDKIARLVEAKLVYPVVVKTTKLGSSVGVGFAQNRSELKELIERFIHYSGEVLVEQAIKGREITVAVLEDPRDGTLQALPLIEIIPRKSQWFDYRAKYEPGATDEICPAPIEEDIADRCRHTALVAHRALGCRALSRSDMIVDSDGQPWIIETNTIPGFTPTSLVPQAAQAAGISYSELVDRIAQIALQKV